MSLHEAAVSGNLESVKALLESKADVNSVDDNGDTSLVAVAKAYISNHSLKSIMVMEYLVKQAKADTSIRSSQGTAMEILEGSPKNTNDPLVSNILTFLGSPKKETTPTISPRRVERTEELKKLLNMHIPDISKPVPYRESTSRPQTPPPSAEVLKLRAENEALRKEVDRLRDIVNKMNPQEQLKVMYSRLVQLEAIESELNNLTL